MKQSGFLKYSRSILNRDIQFLNYLLDKITVMAISTRNIWHLRDIIATNESCFKKMRSLKLFPEIMLCPKCNSIMNINIRENSVYIHARCSRNSDHENQNEVDINLLKDTFMYKGKLRLQQYILLLYCFRWKFTYEQSRQECSIQPNIRMSTATICKYFHLFREALELFALQISRTEGKIGGPNTVVEIDETKIGKRKYNRGRLQEGTWILGMLERQSGNIRLIKCPLNKRDQKTLFELIIENVEPNTTIMTDKWKGYSSLSGSFHHLTVNHTYNFIDPLSHASTQQIEATWSSLKRGILRTHTSKEHLSLYLFEYMVRYYCIKKDISLMKSLCQVLRTMRF